MDMDAIDCSLEIAGPFISQEDTDPAHLTRIQALGFVERVQTMSP